MVIEDGYFLGKFLREANLSDQSAVASALKKYDDLRRPYTNSTTQFARNLGRVYHNIPGPLRGVRDHFLDNVGAVGKKIEEGIVEDAQALLSLVLSEEF